MVPGVDWLSMNVIIGSFTLWPYFGPFLRPKRMLGRNWPKVFHFPASPFPSRIGLVTMGGETEKGEGKGLKQNEIAWEPLFLGVLGGTMRGEKEKRRREGK